MSRSTDWRKRWKALWSCTRRTRSTRDVLSSKIGPKPLFPVPEKFPSLGKYKSELDYQGNVLQSCIHCHQIGDAIKTAYRAKKDSLPEHVLFPYPHPKSLGLILDPKRTRHA